MDGDSFTHDDRAIMNHTDIDVFMSDDDFVVEEETPSDARSLEGLPSELIGMIADYLDGENLSTLQALGSRTILQAIDHALTEANFSSRRCQTTKTSVERLEALSHSRFANRIRIIEIYSLLECRSPNSLRYGVNMDTTTAPCIETMLSESDVRNLFSGILRRTPNLKSVTFRAPLALGGMADHLRYALNSTSNPLPIEDMGFHPRNSTPHSPEHTHIIHALSIYRVMQALVDTIRSAPQQLEGFRVVGFGASQWQTALLGSPKSLFEAISPALRGLTSLNLELDMATFRTDTHVLALVKLIKGNANLEALALSVGAEDVRTYRIRNESWAPLLQLLGGSPPFRLRSLQFNGLVTSTTAPTLASIINVHSSSIRRIVLDNTNFHYPNTLRAFFIACANSTIRYYKAENFWLHERALVVSSQLAYDVSEDEDAKLHEDINTNHCESDAPCHGWVYVSWEKVKHEDGWTVVFKNEDGRKGRNYMYDAFMNGVMLIKDGVLVDS
ncbi:hypothetical protein BKA58DRAFT_19787 [Alternaria rosae]|uniref:uncharacterized protein n=1 Tax=Alternaria rosae TaxID=1187941 RepID=UPI001E8D440F|nr:uncharacterized protein BKA58DRAFT_19787 [Alternaria rosae]KAH6882461.1 hypothetical protein BKA58DRAFT_19787 [Alternaria rosae]